MGLWVVKNLLSFSLSLCWSWRSVGKKHVLGDYGMQIMGVCFKESRCILCFLQTYECTTFIFDIKDCSYLVFFLLELLAK